MHQLGETRSASARNHALFTPETFVRAPLPGMSGATAIVHTSPAMGAAFTWYTAEFDPGGQLGPAPSQRFVYVLGGELIVTVGRKRHTLAPGGYAYLPNGGVVEAPRPQPLPDVRGSEAPHGAEALHDAEALRDAAAPHDAGASHDANAPHDMHSHHAALRSRERERAVGAITPAARAVVIEKPYQPVPGTKPPALLIATEDSVPAAPLNDDPWLTVRKLLPDHPSFDFAVNTMAYLPGATLPMVEIHVMEHGLLMLEGGGIYRLDDRWYPVTAGDFIWMGPYCPQWFGALGKTPAKYIIYKDWNRHPLVTK